MRCGRCGSRYEGYTQRGKVKVPGGEPSKSYFYACGGYIRHGKSVWRLGELPQAMLEEKVVEAVLEFYERYSGDKGVQRLAQTLQAPLAKEDRQSVKKRETIQEQIERIDCASANLLDHLSAANRAMVDRRLAELAQEREQLEVQARKMERLAMDQAQVAQVRDQTVAFVRGLASSLREGSLAERQAAIRRCVESIEVDRERQCLHVAVRSGPLVAGGASEPETRRVVVKIDCPLCLRPMLVSLLGGEATDGSCDPFARAAPVLAAQLPPAHAPARGSPDRAAVLRRRSDHAGDRRGPGEARVRGAADARWRTW